MKKKNFVAKLSLNKKNVAILETEKLIGGTGYTADCPPFTIAALCGTGGTGTAGCGTYNTCLTDAALSCTPRGCGNTLFNC
ncbi:hypothetical protein [Kordia jejudonensis]|uniref:hypothetical protein n=1 Tax=Kordia jejudonensis TaxID=1348245 RepID=UPI00062943F8|nr:hypothetical protein [Kordia jejudonensis]